MKEKQFNEEQAKNLFGMGMDILGEGAYYAKEVGEETFIGFCEKEKDETVKVFMSMCGDKDNLVSIAGVPNKDIRSEVHVSSVESRNGKDTFTMIQSLVLHEGELDFNVIRRNNQFKAAKDVTIVSASLSQGTFSAGSTEQVSFYLEQMERNVTKVGQAEIQNKEEQASKDKPKVASFGEMVKNVAPYVIGGLAIAATAAKIIVGKKGKGLEK